MKISKLNSISHISTEFQLKLCKCLPIEDILHICESIPSWRWIRQSCWFQCLAFRRSAHCSWVDGHICIQFEPQFLPFYFSDPVGTLQYHWWDEIFNSQIWSSNKLSNRSDDIVGSSGKDRCESNIEAPHTDIALVLLLNGSEPHLTALVQPVMKMPTYLGNADDSN